MKRRAFLTSSFATTSLLSLRAVHVRPSRPPGRRPRILLRSGWAVKNIGDIGHTPGTLAVIERHLPGAEVVLWAANVDDTVEAMLRRRFPRLEIVRGHMYDGDKGPSPEIAAAWAETDFYLLNSGMQMNYGLFNHEWGGVVWNLVPMLHSIEHGIPFGVYGQSADKFAYPSLSLFRPVLERAAFFLARDGESVNYLRECEIRPAVCEFGPDGCFGIDVRDDDRADAYLAAHGLEPGRFLAFIVRTNSGTKGSKSPLNPGEPDPAQIAENEHWMSVCVELLNTWVRSTGLPVLICPEASKEIEAAQQHLRPRLPTDIADQVIFRDRFWNADEAVSLYSRARAVFGMEPHSLIMALTTGVPIVHARPLRHGRKGWMFRDIGLGDWLFDIDRDDPARIAATLLAHHHDHDHASARARAAMDFVRERQRAGMAVIASHLNLPVPA